MKTEDDSETWWFFPARKRRGKVPLWKTLLWWHLNIAVVCFLLWCGYEVYERVSWWSRSNLPLFGLDAPRSTRWRITSAILFGVMEFAFWMRVVLPRKPGARVFTGLFGGLKLVISGLIPLFVNTVYGENVYPYQPVMLYLALSELAFAFLGYDGDYELILKL